VETKRPAQLFGRKKVVSGDLIAMVTTALDREKWLRVR